MFGFFSVAFISRPKSRLTETNMFASCDSIVRTSEVENICQQINASLNIYKFHVKTHQDTSKTHKYLEFNTSDTNTHACILLFYNKLKTLSIFTSQTNCTRKQQLFFSYLISVRLDVGPAQSLWESWHIWCHTKHMPHIPHLTHACIAKWQDVSFSNYIKLYDLLLYFSVISRRWLIKNQNIILEELLLFTEIFGEYCIHSSSEFA